MTVKNEPNLGINYGWDLGESGFNLQMDENLKAFGALIQIAVISTTIGTPPGSPTLGDRYLIPAGATGVWAGNDGKIARYIDAAWELYTPKSGWIVQAQDTFQLWHYNGSNWALYYSRFTKYADDTAAAAGSVPVDGFYVATTGGLRVRLT